MLKNNINSKRSQVAIFVILALAIVVGITIFFVIRGNLIQQRVPPQIQPAYDAYLSCIEQETITAAGLMGLQSGYLEVPEFVAGSDFMPFGSQLDFLGTPVPYWYYVSGNNLPAEQVPDKRLMQDQLNDYLVDRIGECDLDSLSSQGFLVDAQEPTVTSRINNDNIELAVRQDLNITFGEFSVFLTNHELNVDSRLGEFYDLALEIYNHEKDSKFLEYYAEDNLRLYAPVDSLELTCSPQIWSILDIREDLQEAVSGNTQAIKIKGSYYDLKNERNKYFIQDVGVNVGDRGEQVSFVNIPSFPFKIDVEPREGNFLISRPIGTQPGLGALGFCFSGYHFVYDIAYPVLVQIYDSDEIFQFPVGVVINKNLPYESTSEGLPDLAPEMCKDDRRLTEMNVYTFDNTLSPVEADVSFSCFASSCNIGKTTIQGPDSVLTENFPQCSNAVIKAKAEGYAPSSIIVDTINSGSVDLILNKLYNLNLELTVAGRSLSRSSALINFVSDDNSFSVIYPEQNTVSLSQGLYNVSVMIYEDASIQIQQTQTKKCVEVPVQGVVGLIGQTEEKCFDFDIPSQVASAALTAGGNSVEFFAEEDLQGARVISLVAEDFGIPTNLDDIEDNYNNLEGGFVSVEIK